MFVYYYSPGGVITNLAVTSGQSSVTSGAVFAAGNYVVSAEAVIGGVTYTAGASAATVVNADITVAKTLA